MTDSVFMILLVEKQSGKTFDHVNFISRTKDSVLWEKMSCVLQRIFKRAKFLVCWEDYFSFDSLEIFRKLQHKRLVQKHESYKG